jgi:histidyl-tRNA synthetase
LVATAERSYKKPLKWFAIPQLFRYERQQKGRLREHFQFNADILGEKDIAADAELIALLIDTLRSFGLSAEDFVIRLSSRNAWREFFLSRHNEETQAYAFYQVVDKLEREAPEASDKKLRELGFSLEEVSAFIKAAEPTAELQAILGDLKARGLSEFVKIDYGVIRGLAYYTGPVFEAFDRKGKFRAIAGGGRYDNLVKLISGGKVDMPALGFGMGDVVLTLLLQERLQKQPALSGLDVFVLVEDEALRGESLGLVQRLREAGLTVDFALTPAKSDKQFKRALELQASHTARVDRGASGELLARIKNLRTREEKVLPTADVATHLRPQISGS